MVDLRGKRVLVTGGTGFVGGRLVERLFVDCGAQVRVLVHRWARAAWAVRCPVEFVQGDLADAGAVRTAVRGCSVVFHCASGGSDAASYRAVNVNGTRHVLEAAREVGVDRFVHVSSAVVHGLENDGRIDESTPFRASNHPYTVSKVEGENAVWDYGGRFEMPVTVVRPAFVWGPRGGQYTVGPVQAMADGIFVWVDEGRAECPVVYVDNLVDFLLLVAVHPAAVGEAFLVADGEGITWRDYFGAYARMLGVRPTRSLRSRHPAVFGAAAWVDSADRWGERLRGSPAPFWRRVCRRSLREYRLWLGRRGIMGRRQMAMLARRGGVSIEKARRVLGYVPRIALEEGMQETERWLRDQLPAVMRTEVGGD